MKLQYYKLGLNLDYRTDDYEFIMQSTGEPWRCKSEWFCRIGLRPKLWAKEYLYYDGHYIKSVTILGLEFTLGYTYDSRPQKEWE